VDLEDAVRDPERLGHPERGSAGGRLHRADLVPIQEEHFTPELAGDGEASEAGPHHDGVIIPGGHFQAQHTRKAEQMNGSRPRGRRPAPSGGRFAQRAQHPAREEEHHQHEENAEVEEPALGQALQDLRAREQRAAQPAQVELARSPASGCASSQLLLDLPLRSTVEAAADH